MWVCKSVLVYGEGREGGGKKTRERERERERQALLCLKKRIEQSEGRILSGDSVSSLFALPSSHSRSLSPLSFVSASLCLACSKILFLVEAVVVLDVSFRPCFSPPRSCKNSDPGVSMLAKFFFFFFFLSRFAARRSPAGAREQGQAKELHCAARLPRRCYAANGVPGKKGPVSLMRMGNIGERTKTRRHGACKSLATKKKTNSPKLQQHAVRPLRNNRDGGDGAPLAAAAAVNVWM
ncbi:hypothetical protein GGS23DRAFT_147166 [Durotheca rogersii]|uniref:uncharacterized protein n=1 Tax=Durotheca rogersii TaxID=419775 RepID=UPI00221EA798|nr:uncharacterized protein GGS23DRAFT_147166 [Durotheca rogersii]KAI5861337.1 hypothetical protein GGS23DRAFT_147166 [Durotheca rogersii]